MTPTLPTWLLKKWQHLANLTAKITDVPIALIMITYTETMEVLISSETPHNPYNSGDKEAWHGLYCETVIKSQKKLLVPNATKDPDWNKNPDIKLGMISYLGYPLNYPDNTPFGTICVLDSKENAYSKDIEEFLVTVKSILEADIALRLHYHNRQQAVSELVNVDQILHKEHITHIREDLQEIRKISQTLAARDSFDRTMLAELLAKSETALLALKQIDITTL